MQGAIYSLHDHMDHNYMDIFYLLHIINFSDEGNVRQLCQLTAAEFQAVALIVNRAVAGQDLDDLATELGLWDTSALSSAVAKLEQVRRSLQQADAGPDPEPT